MRVEFKQTRAIDRHRFAKGFHDVPESLIDHWYLQALVKSGDAVFVDGEAQAAALKKKAPSKKKIPKEDEKKPTLEFKKEEEK